MRPARAVRPADDDHDLTDWANNLDGGGGGISALALACLLASPSSSLDWVPRRTAGGPATTECGGREGGRKEERQEYRSACRVPIAGSPSSPSFRSLTLAAGFGSSTATNCTWQRREGKKANI